MASDDQDHPLPDLAECGCCETAFGFDRHEVYAACLDEMHEAIVADQEEIGERCSAHRLIAGS
jgi:hypothetical protein